MSGNRFDNLSEDERQLARKVEQAFAGVSYPGDLNLVANPSDPDSMELRESLRGKHWSVLPLQTIFYHRGDLSFLTAAAFQFYLPALLLGALLYPVETDTLRENLFYTLTPPPRDQEGTTRFQERIRGLQDDQLGVIREFMLSFASSEPYYPKDIRERAWRYWMPVQ